MENVGGRTQCLDRSYLVFKLIITQITELSSSWEKWTYDGWSTVTRKARMGDPYHHEGITNPQRVPPLRTMWNLNSLAVNCDHHSWCLTHCTSGKGKGERI